MNDDDFGELLRTIRQRTRASGRGDLDSLLMESRLVDTQNSKNAVLEYLSGLRDEMALGGEEVVRESMRRLRNIRTESGSHVDGIVVAIDAQHQPAYGVLEVDLVGSPELDQAVAQIEHLLSELRAEDLP